MTSNEIKWASKHEWFIGHGLNGIAVIDKQFKAGMRSAVSTTLYFTDFAKLYAWAGY